MRSAAGPPSRPASWNPSLTAAPLSVVLWLRSLYAWTLLPQVVVASGVSHGSAAIIGFLLNPSIATMIGGTKVCGVRSGMPVGCGVTSLIGPSVGTWVAPVGSAQTR